PVRQGEPPPIDDRRRRLRAQGGQGRGRASRGRRAVPLPRIRDPGRGRPRTSARSRAIDCGYLNKEHPMAESVVLKTDLPGLKHVSSGKVRDMFDLGDSLLIVTTDRISAFDVVMANGIPFKGKVLNRLSEFWFNFLGVQHHMVTCDVEKMPAEARRHRDILRDRSMLVKKAEPFPVECVARGYLIGSGWK